MRQKALLSCLLIASSAALAQNVTDAVQRQCAACHGIDGVSTKSGTPHLNGQQDTYLISAMNQLKTGKQPTGVTNHVPQALDVDAIDAIATHYATSKAVRPKQEVDPEKVARGETVVQNKCGDCHMDNGREAEHDAPLVAAQDLNYLIAQNKLFVEGKRKFGYRQDTAFKGVSDEDLVAAAHFFASQDQIKIATPSKKKMRR